MSQPEQLMPSFGPISKAAVSAKGPPIITPASRIVIIRAENRGVIVGADNRGVIVGAEKRTVII